MKILVINSCEDSTEIFALITNFKLTSLFLFSLVLIFGVSVQGMG